MEEDEAEALGPFPTTIRLILCIDRLGGRTGGQIYIPQAAACVNASIYVYRSLKISKTHCQHTRNIIVREINKCKGFNPDINETFQIETHCGMLSDSYL